MPRTRQILQDDRHLHQTTVTIIQTTSLDLTLDSSQLKEHHLEEIYHPACLATINRTRHFLQDDHHLHQTTVSFTQPKA